MTCVPQRIIRPNVSLGLPLPETIEDALEIGNKSQRGMCSCVKPDFCQRRKSSQTKLQKPSRPGVLSGHSFQQPTIESCNYTTILTNQLVLKKLLRGLVIKYQRAGFGPPCSRLIVIILSERASQPFILMIYFNIQFFS